MFFHYFIHFMGYLSFFHPRARARGQGALREILKEVRGAGFPFGSKGLRTDFLQLRKVTG